MLNICFSFCILDLAGVASGATRAALTQHFSLANNAADISAKVPYLFHFFFGKAFEMN